MLTYLLTSCCLFLISRQQLCRVALAAAVVGAAVVVAAVVVQEVRVWQSRLGGAALHLLDAA